MIVAAFSAWVLVTGVVPRVTPPRLPRVRARVVAASLLTGVLGAVVALGLVGVPSAAISVGVLLSAIPAMVDEGSRRRRKEAIAASWPDVLARMRARLAGGSTLVESFIDGIAGAPSHLSSMSMRIEEAVRYGSGFGAALDEMRAELADPIADRVAMTLAVANGAGGRKVGEVLAALSTSVADELRLRRAHHAAMTEQRLTAAVALIAPWALLGLTLATNPQATAAYLTPTGTLIVAIGLAGTGLGYLFAARSARLTEAPRVFE